MRAKALPVATVALVLLVVWYLGALWLNAAAAIEQLDRAGPAWSSADFLAQALAMKRPVLPTPDQIAFELYVSTATYPVDSVRSLLYHTAVTAETTLVGFLLGLGLGALLAVGIVHVRTLDSSLMPWIIASQTIPILAIAPMVVVILGNMGFTGLLPKAVISMYLCFFPITIGLVKGLRSADPLALDLMRTYSASPSQTFWRLRLPTALPYLFTSLKIAVATSLVGAIVGELPTGGAAGLGARLLSGSYYGQTVQIWAALVMAAVLSLFLVGGVELIERLVLGRTGGHR